MRFVVNRSRIEGGNAKAKYEDLAAELGLTEGALRVAVHRLRRQFGAILREVVAETVERDEAVEEELRYLLDIVSDPRPLT